MGSGGACDGEVVVHVMGSGGACDGEWWCM